MKNQMKNVWDWWLSGSIPIKVISFVFVLIAMAFLAVLWVALRAVSDVTTNETDIAKRAKNQAEELFEDNFKETQKKNKEFEKQLKEQSDKRDALKKKRFLDEKDAKNLHDTIDDCDSFECVSDTINSTRKRRS